MGKFVDLTGQRFGRLFVLKFKGRDKSSHYKWECQCDCGKITFVDATHLKNGHTQSCGCLHKELLSKRNFKDLTNHTFGMLLVLNCVGKNNRRNYLWECRCECGNIKIVSEVHLTQGYTKSCGCRQGNLIHGLSNTREYKNTCSNKRRELKKELDNEWNTELEIEIRRFFPACVVCGMTIQEHLEKYKQSLHVDHVFPLSKGNGLKHGNAVVLCKHCNTSKRNRNLENLPEDVRNKIITAAQEFKDYWESLHDTSYLAAD